MGRESELILNSFHDCDRYRRNGKELLLKDFAGQHTGRTERPFSLIIKAGEG